jgi:hypothetical protein
VGKNGKLQLLTKWEGYTSDENTWEDADKKLEEIPTIVQDYFSTIDNDEIFSDPHLQKYYNKMIGYSYSKAALERTCSKNKSDTRDDVGITADITNQTTLDQPTLTSCGHRDHSNLENYMPEKDANLCKKGKYCHGKMCRECKALFDEEIDGDVEGQLFVKPTKTHPVWVCVGLTIDMHRCHEAMCDNCARRMPNYSQLKKSSNI